MENYLDINRNSWNTKVETHLKSDFYDVEGFLKGKTSLKEIELDLLGNISGKKILHLQCHFGQDSISLSRMGAEVTGVDFSDEAIKTAKDLAKKCNVNTKFICSDIYNLPEILDEKFDMVFASYGVIGWLPDMEKWGNVVQHFLKPDGKFVFAEFHPFVWMYDNDFQYLKYSYFNTEQIEEIAEGTYADQSAEIKTETITWNHPTSEVLNALIKNNLEINRFLEYNYSPYECFKNMEEIEGQQFIIPQFGGKIPMVFAILATKKLP